VAEREGFEPSDPHYQVNSLAVSPIRPLWHLSVTHHCRATMARYMISWTNFVELCRFLSYRSALTYQERAFEGWRDLDTDDQPQRRVDQRDTRFTSM